MIGGNILLTLTSAVANLIAQLLTDVQHHEPWSNLVLKLSNDTQQK